MKIDLVPDEPNQDQIPYAEAVEKGRNLVLVMKDSQFELGEIAHKLETKYQEKTLERFADDIGIDYSESSQLQSTKRPNNPG